jgi:hypothetical protein
MALHGVNDDRLRRALLESYLALDAHEETPIVLRKLRDADIKTAILSNAELEDLGAKDLKGITGPVRAWTAIRPSSVESRFEALHASGLTELIGREEELEILLRRWSKAKAGEGQVVLLSGEPGIGKSRLSAALMERVAPCTRSLGRWSAQLDLRQTTRFR